MLVTGSTRHRSVRAGGGESEGMTVGDCYAGRGESLPGLPLEKVFVVTGFGRWVGILDEQTFLKSKPYCFFPAAVQILLR